MPEQVYKIVIPNERFKYLSSFQIFILGINAICISLIAYLHNKPLNFIWAVLLVISIVFILKKEHLMQFPFFKKTNLVDSGFLWAIFGWLFLLEFWVALAVTVVGLLQGLVKKQFEFVFRDKEIHLRIFPQRRIRWQDLNNVVLKDGLLTVDFLSNKIIQGEVIPGESDYTSEEEFNQFCQSHFTRKDI
ncbi:hypothetical protein [Limnovirga soli]|uniref:Uncharacterized protein n=1 Tax=Limnovirga soli TaxID=2656915 RepID=A0A8J8JWB3_9BACT|nr:hypothetical protein [Limnovirga soli]NNV55116.1 hypothetical protein [Limnovirga soli]